MFLSTSTESTFLFFSFSSFLGWMKSRSKRRSETLHRTYRPTVFGNGSHGARCNSVIKVDTRASYRPLAYRSSRATATVSHRARSASYDMLRKQYTAQASCNGGEARLLCPVYPRKPRLARAHYSISQESDVARSFLEATKEVPFCRYENLAKIKNRRPIPSTTYPTLYSIPSPSSSLFTYPPPLWRCRGGGKG